LGRCRRIDWRKCQQRRQGTLDSCLRRNDGSIHLILLRLLAATAPAPSFRPFDVSTFSAAPTISPWLVRIRIRITPRRAR
jgi:hypothetical protein